MTTSPHSMDWDCEMDPHPNSSLTSQTTLSLQQVSSFLQQNPHLFNQLQSNPLDDSLDIKLDFSALKLNQGTDEEILRFLEALKPVESNPRQEYCKQHLWHKLSYMGKNGDLLCEICLTDPMAETDSQV